MGEITDLINLFWILFSLFIAAVVAILILGGFTLRCLYRFFFPAKRAARLDTPAITVRRGDICNDADATRVLYLLSQYALDDMGGGRPLCDYTQTHLIEGLRGQPTLRIYLAFVDSPEETEAVGMALCFGAFSTFKCRPLLNIHDFVTQAQWRGMGVGRAMLEAIERDCRDSGFCKVTLEVLCNNKGAMRLYSKSGFEPYVLTQEAGPAQFWQKVF